MKKLKKPEIPVWRKIYVDMYDEEGKYDIVGILDDENKPYVFVRLSTDILMIDPKRFIDRCQYGEDDYEIRDSLVHYEMENSVQDGKNRLEEIVRHYTRYRWSDLKEEFGLNKTFIPAGYMKFGEDVVCELYNRIRHMLDGLYLGV